MANIKSINCSVPCLTLLNILNSCPSKELNLWEILNLNFSQIFELLMIVFSISPYFICFIIIILCAIQRTTRCVFILLMIFIEVLIK
jgi:hypothetical protein